MTFVFFDPREMAYHEVKAELRAFLAGLGVTAIPMGALNCPLPDPAIPALHPLVQISYSVLALITPNPNASKNSPFSLNSSIRLFAPSLT